MSLFRTLFGEADATGVASLLSPEQRAAIDRQSMMALGARLLQASGPSQQRTNTAQAVGGALQAAMEAQQAGQMNAVQQMLLGQKIQEAKDTRERNAAIRGIFSPATAQPTAQPTAAMPAAGTPLTPEQALLAGGVGRPGPTMQRAELTIPGATMPTTAQPATQPAAPMGLREFAATLPLAVQQSLQAMDPNEALKALNERYNASSKFGAPEFFMREGKMVAIQRNELGEERERPGLAPRDTPPSTILEYEYATRQGYQGSLQQYIMDRQRAGASNQTVITGGQKGFDNERTLRNDFRAEPSVKAFEDMTASYSAVQSALKQGTPIGDVAAATKIMKLLDPGSVVRESELGIAMEAAGKLNRLREYFSMWKDGRKLGTQQLADFDALSRELMAASAQAYNNTRMRYENIASDYGLNVGRIVGEPAKVPETRPRPQPAGPRRDGAATGAAPASGAIGSGTFDVERYFR